MCAASYLGSSSDDIGAAVAIAPDQTVVLGGTIAGNNFGLSPYNLQAGSSTSPGGNGVIIRTDRTGKNIQSVTRLGNTIDGIDVNQNDGTITAIGDFGLAQLNAQANSVSWSKNTTALAPSPGPGSQASTGRRIAVGKNGTLVTLFSGNVTVFDSGGNKIGQFIPSGTYVEDVTVDSPSSTVIVTGFSQKDGGGCSQLQVAFIRGYDYQGNLKWTDYDWTHATAYSNGSSCADTRGDRVSIGKDGKLYFAGETAGGNNIYRYDPKNIAQAAPNVTYDAYNTTYNTSSSHLTYYARLDPATGTVEKGQYALARLSQDASGLGNTIVPRAITADESGNVYIGGITAYTIPNRDPVNLSISGKPLGIYAGGDGFILVVSPDFSSRKIWTAWTGANTSTQPTTINGVAVAKGVAAIMATAKGNMITVNPVQSSNAGGTDAFYSVFPALP